VFQHLNVVVREVHPYLHPEERLDILWRDKPKSVDMLAVVKVLPQQVEY
jgi:hypothetical protein